MKFDDDVELNECGTHTTRRRISLEIWKELFSCDSAEQKKKKGSTVKLVVRYL